MSKSKPRKTYRGFNSIHSNTTCDDFSLLAFFQKLTLSVLFSLWAPLGALSAPIETIGGLTFETTTTPNATIKLKWQTPNEGAFRVWRRERSAPSPTVVADNLSSATTEWVDANVTVGSSFDYALQRINYSNTGYNPAGIEVPLNDERGTVLIIVDEAHANALSHQIARFESDLGGDGWIVERVDFDPTLLLDYKARVESLKSLINTRFAINPSLKSIVLLGHLPVARTGTLAADGHGCCNMQVWPFHEGAWATDVYYAAHPTQVWTDDVENLNSTFLHNHNRPGDGKWDQDFIDNVALEIGRIDFHDMPRFSSIADAEVRDRELLRRYLEKNHQFRWGRKTYTRRALIDAGFPFHSGAPNEVLFMGHEINTFVGMFGSANVHPLSYFPTLAGNDYLWAAACGSASFVEMHHIGSSSTPTYCYPQYPATCEYSFSQDQIRAPFTMLYGSYFGDWDYQDNFLRAPLCNSETLISVYLGPGLHNYQGYPYLTEMALGETVGYAVRKALHFGPLASTLAPRHISIMGDPTLRLHVVRPPTNVTAQTFGSSIVLNWTEPDPLLEPAAGGAHLPGLHGYHVYRGATHRGPFTRLNGTLIPTTTKTFTDSSPSSTEKVYMVRAVKLEESPAGTYWNASQGAYPALRLAAISSTPTAFQYSIAGGVGQVVRVEMATSANATTWTTIATVTLTSGSTTLTYNTTGSQRYYRLASDQVPFWSDNVIGFVRRTVPVGSSLIANQFNRGNNNVETILPSPPEGTQLHRYNDSNATYSMAQFVDGAWEGDLPLTFSPGQGAWFLNPTPGPITITFMGDVPQGTLVNSIPDGNSLKSSMVPQSGRLDTDLGFVVSEGDTVNQLNPNTGTYILNQWNDGAWEGDTPGGPIISIGESFWIDTAAPKTWTREFKATP